jgi:hypothetical protein
MYNSPNPSNKKLFFQGNSLIDTDQNHVVNNQKYVTYTIYNTLRLTYPNLALFDYSISGQTQATINTKMAQQFNSSSINADDVVLNMEGLNNLWGFPAKTAQESFDQMQAWVNHVYQFTSKIIICTVSATDILGDVNNVFGRCQTYNQLLRDYLVNAQICDIALDSAFDTQAACSNATYYDTDKVHWIKGGQDRFITLTTPYITALL